MLVTKYQANILTLCWSILGDKEEAKDVTQEAFIQAYLNLHRFDMTRSFKNWLYSIAYRKCIDRKRKEKSAIKFLKSTAKVARLNSDCKKEERRIEDSEVFSSIMNKLNAKEQTAISLKVNEGYLAREIAEVLDCAESTVRVLLFNAKRKLKRLLEERKDV